MIKAMKVGRTLVCTIQEKMYQKVIDSDAELLDIYELALNTDESNPLELENLLNIFVPSKTDKEIQVETEYNALKEEAEADKELVDWMENIKTNGDPNFEVKEFKLYLKGINITVPHFLAKEFAARDNISYLTDDSTDLDSLINFWKLCALNSDPRCREDLYKFLINNNMVVTPSGYFLAYRNAQIKNEGDSREYIEFIQQQFTKIKGQKKSPKNYDVIFDEVDDVYILQKNKKGFLIKTYELEEGQKVLGNLQKLHSELKTDEQPMYTDAHSRTTEIIVGEPVSIDRSQCDSNPNQTCSRGLHLGSSNFMGKDYYGEVGLVCLCNPMHVVAVPYSGGQKLRTSEYLPIGIAEYDKEGSIVPVETATFEYDYAEYTQEQLDELIDKSAYNFESLKDHQIIPKEMDLESFQKIVGLLAVSLEEMNEVIQNRVHNV